MFSHTLYHWLGYNKAIFLYIHDFSHNVYWIKTCKFIGDYVGEHKWFPLHLTILIAIMALYLKHSSKYKHNVNARATFTKGLLIKIIIMICSLCVGAICVELIKLYFAMPRPYCIDDISVQYRWDMSKCYKSFVSGHSCYVVIFVASLWGILNNYFKIFGLSLIILVGISRIVLGMHFPSDVIGGYIVGLVVTTAVASLISKHLYKFDCTLKKLATKI